MNILNFINVIFNLIDLCMVQILPYKPVLGWVHSVMSLTKLLMTSSHSASIDLDYRWRLQVEVGCKLPLGLENGLAYRPTFLLKT